MVGKSAQIWLRPYSKELPLSPPSVKVWELNRFLSFQHPPCDGCAVQPGVQVSGLLPCRVTEVFTPLAAPGSAWAGAGMRNVTVGTLRLEGGEGRIKSGQGETGTIWMSRLGIRRKQTLPEHGRELKTSVAPTSYFQLADKGQWPECPSPAMVTHVGQVSVQDLQLNCLQVIQPQHTTVMETILCE